MKSKKHPRLCAADIVKSSGSGRNRKGCDIPTCDRPGDYPAPRGRSQLSDYFWFCLDHVREYNRSWNYYEGMNEAEIEYHIRLDTTWQRPTWPFSGGRRTDLPNIHLDSFAPENWESSNFHTANPLRPQWKPRPNSVEERAADELNLQGPITRETVKAKYKQLVKKYHPDSHGGDKHAEERLKVINHAYSVLMACPGMPLTNESREFN